MKQEANQVLEANPGSLTAYQSKYYAHELLRSYSNDHVGKLAGLLFDAQVEPKPHQIDAALFALQTPYLPGVILADEVGLGKTIEAGIVITQYWAERRRRICSDPSRRPTGWSMCRLARRWRRGRRSA